MWAGALSQRICPSVGGQSPEIVLIVTDLPAPLSPTSAVTLPGGTLRLTPFKACTAPKALLTFRSSSSGFASVMLAPPVTVGWIGQLAQSPTSRPGEPEREVGLSSLLSDRHYREGPVGPTICYGVMPAAVQSLAYWPAHSCEVGTKLSLTIVLFMFAVVTHSGTASTDGTLTLDVVSLVDPFTSDEGGL